MEHIMNDFHFLSDELWCEQVTLQEIAERIGTPFYVYSSNTLKNHYRVFDKAFSSVPHIICYSVKSNSNIAVLRLFVREGSGLDVVSGGELYRAAQAGVDPKKVVYSGVGKRDEEIQYALSQDILLFNVESPQELERINEHAARMKRKASIGLRVNPDINAQTHAHISTGLKENKFGIPFEKAVDVYRQAASLPNLDIRAVSCHIGSQITKVSPFLDALTRLRTLIEELRRIGIRLQYLNLGGGLGINYAEESPPHPDEYAQAIIKAAGDAGCTFILEPGRVLVGNAGVLVTKVLYTKDNDGKNFIVVDAGMNDLIRPSFYDAYHHIEPVVRKQTRKIKADIVGPICESADYLAKGRTIDQVDSGDLLAVMTAGAYAFVMSSNYNARPRAPEVLVRNNRFHIIRRRENYRDLIRGEKIPTFLRQETKS